MPADNSIVAPRPRISVLYKYDGNTYDISDIVESVNWSGNVSEVSRKLDLSVVITKTQNTIHFVPREGGIVYLMANDSEMFRGVIANVDRTGEGKASVSANDMNWYLAQNTVDYTAKNKTATQVIKELCAKYGVSVGSLADTKFVFKRLVFLKKTISEIFKTVIYETWRQSNRRFALENTKGKLALVAIQPQKVQLEVSRGLNLLAASTKTSIEQTRTQVYLTGGDDEYRAASKKINATATDTAGVRKYGLMRHAEHLSNATSRGQLETTAKAILSKMNEPEWSGEVTFVGDLTVRAGRVLWVDDVVTGLSNSYWVTADTHSIDASGNHTTQAVLSRTLAPEKAVYEEPDTSRPNEGGDGSTVKGNPLTPGISMNWTSGFVATAYNPALGGINGNGDGLVATGPKFSVGRSLAVDPRTIPYGSVVFVKVPGYPKANGIYLAEDTGGAIKGKRLDVGWYKTDCKNFGKRDAQVVILERGYGPADARAKAAKWSTIERKWRNKLQAKPSTPTNVSSGSLSTKRTQVVNAARSKVGKLRYRLGGGNPLLSGSNIGDCSDFTQWAFKQVGISTPNYSPTIWQRYKRISASQVRPGDVVVFTGTIAGRPSGTPSHVGIISGDNRMINLQSYGCKEEAYRTGYWGKYLLGYVRIIND